MARANKNKHVVSVQEIGSWAVLSDEQLAMTRGGADPTAAMGAKANAELFDRKYYEAEIVPMQRHEVALKQHDDEFAAIFESGGNFEFGSATRHLSNHLNDLGLHDETFGILREGPVAETKQEWISAFDQGYAKAMDGAIVVQQIENGHNESPVDANQSNPDASPGRAPEPASPQPSNDSQAPNMSYDPAYPEPNASYDPSYSEPNASYDPGPSEPNASYDPGPAQPNASYDPSYSEPNASYDPGPAQPNASYDPSYSEPNASYDPGPSEPNASYDPGPSQPNASYDPGPSEPNASYDPGPSEPNASYDPGPSQPNASYDTSSSEPNMSSGSSNAPGYAEEHPRLY